MFNKGFEICGRKSGHGYNVLAILIAVDKATEKMRISSKIFQQCERDMFGDCGRGNVFKLRSVSNGHRNKQTRCIINHSNRLSEMSAIAKRQGRFKSSPLEPETWSVSGQCFVPSIFKSNGAGNRLAVFSVR